MSNYLTFSVILFFLILCGPTTFGHRPLSSSSDLNLISDGVHNRDSGWSYLALNRLTAESSTCDQTYGFLPCTTTVIGNIFLIAVYGYLMFLAASYLSHGSELLLEILGPGIIGGLFLPILGALPDAMLILGTLFFLFFSFFILFGSRESWWEKWVENDDTRKSGNGLAPVLQCTGATAMPTRGQNWTRVTLHNGSSALEHWRQTGSWFLTQKRVGNNIWRGWLYVLGN